jgi:hypothetical protein
MFSKLKCRAFCFGFLLLVGCGGEWINDKGNFKRVFGFDKPAAVRVEQSYYWKSPHWSSEYEYFIVLEAPPEFAQGLTNSRLMTPAAPQIAASTGCTYSNRKPAWFMPGSLQEYEAWVPKGDTDYRVFRHKADGRLFVCDLRL